MTTTTTSSRFTTAVGSFLARDVFPYISERLRADKNVSVSVDELVSWCQLPVQAPMQLPSSMMSGPPFNTMPTTTTKSTSRSKKPVIPANYTGPTCDYKFSRGDNKNKVCGAPVSEGTRCKECNKKGGGLHAKASTAGESKKKVEPGLTTPAVAETKATEHELSVIPFPGHEGLYLETTYNFVIKTDNEENIVLGISENGNVRPLTDKERTTATTLGLQLPVSSVVPPSSLPLAVSRPTLPQVPLPPMLPTLPQIPSLHA